MKKVLLVILGVLGVSGLAFAGLSDITRYKSFSSGSLLTAAELNSLQDHFVDAHNLVVDYFPGDSLKVKIHLADTLLSFSISKIVVKDPLTSFDATDSLFYHRAHIYRANLDSMYIGGVPIVGFVGGATAGRRVFWSYARMDTVNINDSLTVRPGAKVVFVAGSVFSVAGIDADTINVDSLTLSGSGKMTALAGSDIAFQAGTTFSATRVNGDTINVDSLTLSASSKATALAGSNIAFQAGSTFSATRINGDTLNVDSLTVTPGGNVSLPAGVVSALARINGDTINVDSLTLSANSKMSALAGSNLSLLAGSTLATARVNGDTVNVDSLTLSANAKATALAGSNTAFKAGSVFSATGIDADSINVDSLTLSASSKTTALAGSNIAFQAGTTFSTTRVNGDTINVDSLTLSGSSKTTALAGSDIALQAGSTFTATGVNTDSINVDSLTLSANGKATALPGSNTAYQAGSVFSATAIDADTINVDSLTLSANAKATALPGANIAFQAGSTFSSAAADIDTLKNNVLVQNQSRVDDLQRAYLAPDSTVVAWRDTTIAISAKNIVGVNLFDPAQCWNYDAFRAAETNTSLWRVDATRVPDVGMWVSSTAGDSISLVDVATGLRTRVYLKAVNNVLGNVATNDMAYQDGSLWLGEAGTLTRIDELQDAATQWTTSGQYDYKARLSSRNAASGYLLLNASPAIVNNTVNAVAVTRSPWPFHVDRLGRRLQYWVAGTANEASAASYNSLGSLNIYDSNWSGNSRISRSLSITPKGLWVEIANNTVLDWVGSFFPWLITADGYGGYFTYHNARTGAEKLRWSSATVMSSVAALDGASGSGNDSPRIFAAADSGLYILDAKAGDNTNGSKQEINARYVSPVMVGNVMCAWSPASTAEVSGRGFAVIRADSSELPSRAYAANAPLGAAWTFNGSNQKVYVNDHDSLTFLVGQPMSISLWIKKTSIWQKPLAQKFGQGHYEWRLFGGDNDLLYFDLYNNDDVSSNIGRKWTTEVPSGIWLHIVATYNGGTTSASLALWVNGVRVDNADDNNNSFTGMTNTTAPLCIGGSRDGLYYNGSMTPPVITREVLTQQQIEDEYRRGLAMIQSPYADTLFTNAVKKVKVNPYSGDMLLVQAGSVSLRDRYGAMIDTFACSTCGTLSDGDFLRVAGVDSLGGGIVFGGATGTRVIVPDPRVYDAAAYRYPYKDYTISSPAVVDSAGYGDFWTLDDALAATNLQGLREVSVKRGTYAPTTISQSKMVVTGSGKQTVISNTGATTRVPMLISGDSVQVRDLTAYSAPGGAGGDSSAVRINGDHNRLERVTVNDADRNAFQIQSGADNNILVDCAVADADSNAIRSTGKYTQIRGGTFTGGVMGLRLDGVVNSAIGAVFSGGGTSVAVAATADSAILIGNKIRGITEVHIGAVKAIVDRNVLTNATYVDYGTGTIDSTNAQ